MRSIAGYAALIGLLAASAAVAHEGATGAVKDRMDAMKAIADDMKLIGRGLRGGGLDPAVSSEAAERVARKAAMMPMHFAEQTVAPPSEALPVIWDEFDRFTAIAADLDDTATAFAGLSASGADADALQAAFREMGATCSACHEDYRIEK